MPNTEIIIFSNGNAGQGHIMQGYIQFYSNNKLSVQIISEHTLTLHPLAIQVMKEDGIDISSYSSALEKDISLAHAKAVININNSMNNLLLNKLPVEFNFSEPLVHSSYESTVIEFRKLREEIKKASIHLVGIFQPVEI